MSSLRFNRIRICSETEQAAVELEFDPRKNLLWGENGTGKSVILKSLYRAFDAEPKGEIPNWDYDAIVAVDFSVGQRSMTSVRAGELRALFEGDRLVAAAASSLDWNAAFAREVGFELKLLDRYGRFREAATSNFFLPFSLSQDAFGSSWETFSGLKQFQKSVDHTLEYFVGVRPPRYFELKAEEQGKKERVASLRVELSTLGRTRSRVRRNLKASPVKLSAKDFQVEIRDLVSRSQELLKKQDALRLAMVEDQTLETSLAEQIRLAEAALKEHEADFKYAGSMKQEGGDFVCPVCHAKHDSSFHTLIDLAEDARELHQRKQGVEGTLDAVRFRLSRSRRKAADLKGEYMGLQSLLAVKRGKFTFDDFIKTYSASAADSQIAAEELEVQKQVDKLSMELKGIAADLRAVKKTHDGEQALSEFRKAFGEAIVELNVDGIKAPESWLLKRKPETSGSRNARGIVAYYVALWRSIAKEGILPAPLVIDSPNQGAQDRANLRTLLTLSSEKAPENTQIFLAHEEMPKKFKADKTFHMVKGKRVLSTDEFMKVGPRLFDYVQRARAALAGVDVTPQDDDGDESDD